MKALWNGLASRINEKNCFRLLLAIFLVFTIMLALVPYDPSTDLADATTNDIWVEHYADGTYHIPYDEWDYQPTQSVVVEHDGQFVVVNEKGPGHVMMLLPFHLAGADFLFAVLMVFFATFSTYMLGKRLFNWKVGFASGILVLTNITVLVMWHRFYWTDASTMHMLVLAVWLLVESLYWLNGESLDPRNPGLAGRRHLFLGIGLGILAGLCFGASVSTRYATALILIALFIYIKIFYFIRTWPDLRKKQYSRAFRKAVEFFVLWGMFTIGLLCVLVPLMQYNSEYFGGPLGSGYDATLVDRFDPAEGVIDRNTTTSWSSSFSSSLYYAGTNFVTLLPAFISRMPLMLLAPLAFWYLRKRPVLSLLLLWVTINLFTYLSLSWVAMYARVLDIFWEPRYFMPALPPLALLAGVAIHKLSVRRRTSLEKRGASKERARTGAVVVATLMVGVLVLAGVGCAVYYFTSPMNARPHGPPGPGQVILATTDQLLLQPEDFLGRPVLVENATVINVLNEMIVIRSDGAVESGGIRVRLVDWPFGEAPVVYMGQHVEVRGMFMRVSPPGQPPQDVLNVKYDTQDYIRLNP